MTGTLVMHKVRPFWGRILVMPSAATEEETPSGIIVPTQAHEDPILTRAIVMRHDPYYEKKDSDSEHYGYPQVELLPVGTVIWYLTGLGKTIGDVVIVDVDDIWAYEEG